MSGNRDGFADGEEIRGREKGTKKKRTAQRRKLLVFEVFVFILVSRTPRVWTKKYV